MAFAEYAEYDGLGLPHSRKGQVTPLELAEEAIARREYNPRLNAVVYKMYDQARETAKRVAGRARVVSAAFLSSSRTSSATTPACRPTPARAF